jgi:CBS-domain-containing membrane protein
MTRNVVAVHEGTAADVARKTLLARGFLALPVRDDRGRLVGIVTKWHLLPRHAQRSARTPSGASWSGM